MVRFQNTGRDSFLGEFAYRRILERHSDHFLVVLDALIDWEERCNRLLSLYRGKGKVGRPPYPPVVLFKMLFVSYLCDESERSVEQLVDLNLVVKWFVGLAVDEPAPDHSSLTKFKQRFLGESGWRELKGIFDEMIEQAREHGVRMGELQILDSVHTSANVNTGKDQARQEGGKGPRDPDARVVHKGRRRVVEADGQTELRDVRYCGYKTHVSLNAESGLITSFEPAPGNSADNRAFGALRDHDRALGLPTRMYGGDKAYDDTDIYERLELEGLKSGITMRECRLKKKDKNRERWEERAADPDYQAAVGLRFRVEQPFGLAKLWHGFGRCRYVGFLRFRVQAFFTVLALNVKTAVKAIAGIDLRPQGRRRNPGAPPGVSEMAWA
jgi:IS5 family transposase